MSACQSTQEKIALVTGGTSGIGLATAKLLAAEGAIVYITGRRPAPLEAAVTAIGANARGIQADSSKLADLDRVIDTIKRERDHLDIVFANAGGGEFAALGDITEAHFDTTFDTNVKGVLFTVQKALPLLREGSSIILNASVVASKGFPSFSVYSATKAAVRSFARTWTADLKGRKIRVNAVSPGPIDTDGLGGLAGGGEGGEALKAQFASTVPLGRIGHVDDIAKAVSFLASDDASFITGTELFVDGGAAQL